MPIRLKNSEDFIVCDLMDAVYEKHKITFEEAKIGLCNLEFFALVRPASIETHFFQSDLLFSPPQ